MIPNHDIQSPENQKRAQYNSKVYRTPSQTPKKQQSGANIRTTSVDTSTRHNKTRVLDTTNQPKMNSMRIFNQRNFIDSSISNTTESLHLDFGGAQAAMIPSSSLTDRDQLNTSTPMYKPSQLMSTTYGGATTRNQVVANPGTNMNISTDSVPFCGIREAFSHRIHGVSENLQKLKRGPLVGGGVSQGPHVLAREFKSGQIQPGQGGPASLQPQKRVQTQSLKTSILNTRLNLNAADLSARKTTVASLKIEGSTKQNHQRKVDESLMTRKFLYKPEPISEPLNAIPQAPRNTSVKLFCSSGSNGGGGPTGGNSYLASFKKDQGGLPMAQLMSSNQKRLLYQAKAGSSSPETKNRRLRSSRVNLAPGAFGQGQTVQTQPVELIPCQGAASKDQFYDQIRKMSDVAQSTLNGLNEPRKAPEARQIIDEQQSSSNNTHGSHLNQLPGPGGSLTAADHFYTMRDVRRPSAICSTTDNIFTVQDTERLRPTVTKVKMGHHSSIGVNQFTTEFASPEMSNLASHRTHDNQPDPSQNRSTRSIHKSPSAGAQADIKSSRSSSKRLGTISEVNTRLEGRMKSLEEKMEYFLEYIGNSEKQREAMMGEILLLRKQLSRGKIIKKTSNKTFEDVSETEKSEESLRFNEYEEERFHLHPESAEMSIVQLISPNLIHSHKGTNATAYTSEEVEVLRKAIESLQKEKQSGMNKMQELSIENERLQSQLTKQAKETAEKTEKLKLFIEEAENKIKANEKCVEETKKEYSHFKSRINGLEKEASELRTQRSKQSRRLKEAEDQLKSRNTKLQKMSEMMKVKEEENKFMSEAIEKKQSEVLRLNEEVTSLTEECIGLKRELKKANNESYKLKTQLEAWEESKQDEAKELKQMLKLRDSEFESYRSMIKDYEKKLLEMRGNNKSLSDKLQEKSEIELRRLKSYEKNYEKKLEDKDKVIQSLTKELEDMQKARGKSEGLVSQARDKNHFLKLQVRYILPKN